jgi:hypothetical protein
MAPDKLETEIIKKLQRIEQKGKHLPDTYMVWTETILTGLAKLGRKHGYHVYTSKYKPKGYIDAGEWLYDPTWLQYDRHGYIKAMPLVLESELGPDSKDLIDDFCKLIVARADHRVMIFGANNKANAEEKITELIAELDHSGLSRNGDRYLFAGLLENNGTFLFQVYKISR